MTFPCTRCGLCCRTVRGIDPLDRGDGTCRHLDEATSLCRVYETRPDACRVRLPAGWDMAERDYFNANIAVCRDLQARAGVPEPLRSQPIP